MADLRSLSRAFSSMRGRSAVLAAFVVAVALTIGALLLLSVFRGRLQDNLDKALQGQVQDRVVLLDQGTDPNSLTGFRDEEAMVWIGTPDGETVATGGVLFPLENPIPSSVGGVVTVTMSVEERKPDEVETEIAELRLASATAQGGELVVITATENEQINETINQLARLFAIAVPVMVLIVGALTWLTTGRALRPVERIRRRADEVSGTNLSERVPVPDSNDEIQHLAATMNEMLGRLEAHELRQRQFAADASHELKSPLANLRALVDTANLSDPQWASLQNTMAGEAERMGVLVDNLLYLAKHGEGETSTASFGTVHLDDVLFDEAEIASATGRAGIDINGVTPVTVQGVEADLKRMVRNLVDNASRYASSSVWVHCGRDDDRGAVLVVSDDGPGVPVGERALIFERFTRLDEARNPGSGGTGLGLAIVKEIADAHGATVKVDDRPGGGALFSVWFAD